MLYKKRDSRISLKKAKYSPVNQYMVIITGDNSHWIYYVS